MAWGVLPPALRHTHEGGGEKDHRHFAVAGQGEEHGHYHDRDAGHHGHEHESVAAPPVLADAVVHLHWEIFGFGFSMPAPDQSEHGDNGNGLEPALVRLADELPTVNANGGSPARASPLSPPELALDLVPVTTSPSRPPNLITSIPLCDSARLERSGVLLA
jgi:hypothetical protein